jgi:DNA-binding transcriptional LysR family regulator
VTLTHAGRILKERSARVLAEFDRVVEDAKRASQGTQTLRIGFTAYSATAVLPAILRRLRAIAPALEVDMIEDSSRGNVAAVVQGRVDVGLVSGSFIPASIGEPPLKSVVIHRELLLAAMSRRHPFASQRRIALSQLAGEEMVLFPRRLAPVFHDELVSACQGAGFSARVSKRAAGYDRILAAVAEGGVVSLVPRSVAKRRSDVRFVGLRDRPTAAISMVFFDDARSKSIQALVRAVGDNR